MKPIPYKEGQTEHTFWCLLSPFGEFPGTITGVDGSKRRGVQICDRQAFEALIADHDGTELLVDFEHRSDVPKIDSDTTAAGWIQELRLTADGIEALVAWTDIGVDDLSHRRRRFLSPVWELDANGRPSHLTKAALTNGNNIRMRPVLNKPEPPAPDGGTTQRSPDMDIKQLAKALGLPETATAEEVLAAVKASQDKASTLEARIAELEAGALATEADAVVAQNKARIADPAAFKKVFVQNKDCAMAVLATIAEPTAPIVTNKAAASKPAIATAGGKAPDTASNKLEAWKAMPEGPKKETFFVANKAELLKLDNLD